ncbi:hypothetical protein FBZ93_11615 [Bradyrhizobium macuxiense]|uniref:Uncharacterized protein n=1 Tax=Bradyrhizobium macuxiense TaxID=1755647 RepID=A0A560L813_9BRAD|nr:hypothetical protein FBZ93_11615 [Bradyrhizobium macuxiense]
MRCRHNSERGQLDLFRALPSDPAPREVQDLMAFPFFLLAKTKRIVPIDLVTSVACLCTQHMQFADPRAHGSRFQLQGASA